MSSVKNGLRFAGRFLAVDGAIAAVDRFGRRSVGVVGIDQEECPAQSQMDVAWMVLSGGAVDRKVMRPWQPSAFICNWVCMDRVSSCAWRGYYAQVERRLRYSPCAIDCEVMPQTSLQLRGGTEVSRAR